MNRDIEQKLDAALEAHEEAFKKFLKKRPIKKIFYRS